MAQCPLSERIPVNTARTSSETVFSPKGIADSADDAWLAKAGGHSYSRGRRRWSTSPSLRAFYLSDTLTFDPKATSKFLTPDTARCWKSCKRKLTALPAWSEHELEEVFTRSVQEEQLKGPWADRATGAGGTDWRHREPWYF